MDKRLRASRKDQETDLKAKRQLGIINTERLKSEQVESVSDKECKRVREKI